jgi:hypothetical protein
VRATLNADIRSTFAPNGGIFDTGAAVEVSTKWIANKTTDGIHPDQSGYLDIKPTIDTTRIGTPEAVPAETGSAWGAAGTLITLSTTRRANDTATSTGASPPTFCTVRGAGGNSSGLKYFEIELLGLQELGIIVGLIDGTTAAGAGLDDTVGSIPNSYGNFSAGGSGFATAPFTATGTGGDFSHNAGDVFGLAVDFTNKFSYLARNGVWFLSGAPTSGATGTGHVATWTGTPTLYPGISSWRSSRPMRLRTSSLLYSPPSGYSAWG